MRAARPKTSLENQLENYQLKAKYLYFFCSFAAEIQIESHVWGAAA
jgi:hypothetical protein